MVNPDHYPWTGEERRLVERIVSGEPNPNGAWKDAPETLPISDSFALNVWAWWSRVTLADVLLSTAWGVAFGLGVAVFLYWLIFR